MESNPETLEELMSNDAMIEGDMILSTDRNAVETTWPTQEIPYAISPELAGRTSDILAAMAMVSEHTCVSFHKRITETNYLLFKASRGCASYVGFVGGEQPVFVGPPCMVGNIAHEVLHALGFHHEHTRTDREQYITVLPHNIMAGMEKNFKKQEGKTFDLPYDISSIMHYGSGFFSSNGLPTIVPNTDVKQMGQRVKMTNRDVERVRHLYNCDASKKPTEKESSDAEKAEDSNIDMVIQSMKASLGSAHTGNQNQNQNQNDAPANTTEKSHSSISAAPPTSLQHLNAATGGQSNT
uniref:Metalloendopeptidase n=1 Tax=Seriola dumerili TaxID=41447 RepID=A0A3B4TRI3_SERDU